jgi:hypothetical protein
MTNEHAGGSHKQASNHGNESGPRVCADQGRSRPEKSQQGGSTAYRSSEPQHHGASDQNGWVVGYLRRRYRPQGAREAAFVGERRAGGEYGADENGADHDT